MSDDELRELVGKARALMCAAPIGPIHAIRDVIVDAEEILAGRSPVLNNRPYVEKVLVLFTV